MSKPMAMVRILLIATVMLGLGWSDASAQGSGPGFHVSVGGGLNCPGGEQTLSLPAPPASLGPVTFPCTSGQGSAAAEAGVSMLRASGRSEHTCCGTASGGSGLARIQFDNVVITGSTAASVPVSINFGLRGTITANPSLGQTMLSVFLRLSFLSSLSQIETNENGIFSQTGVFAPLTVGFPTATIDQLFVTHVANVPPNQPLLFELQLWAGTGMAGEGFTETDFFSGNNGFFLPFGVPVFNLPPGYTITIPELNIIDNYVALPATLNGDVFIVGSDASEISLPGVTEVAGSISISGNASLTTLDVGDLDSIDGNLNVSDNASLTSLDLGSLDTVGGIMTVSNNASMTTLNLSDLDSVGGSMSIDGNTSASGVNLGDLDSVGASLTIANNGPCTTVTMGVLTTVAGHLTVETCGTGTFTPGPVAAGQDTTLNTTGYTVVSGTTATGSTTVTTGTSDAIMTVRLPAGSFTTPVPFTLTELDPATLSPEDGIGASGEPATIDPIAAYQLTFGVPTLNADASLTFNVVVANLDTATATALFDALAAGTATLVTRSDLPGSQYQAFPICADGQLPAAGGCVVVQLLDADGQPTTGTPAVIRFSNVVGHFSTWAVAIVTPDDTPSPFVFAGLLAPYPSPPLMTTPTFKRGRVVPLKFAWATPAGTLVDSSAAAPTIAIYATSCTAQAPTTQPITADDAGDSGGLRYDATAATWIFNWSTKGLAAGCFAIEVTPATTMFAPPGSTFAIALRDR